MRTREGGITVAQTTIKDKVTTHENDLGIIPAQPGYPQVADIEAFLSQLPKFTDEEVKAFEEAIAEDRAERRAALICPEAHQSHI